MSQYRWGLPLPSNGRAGPRLNGIDVNNPLPPTYQGRLELLLLETKSRGGLTRWSRLPRALLRRCGIGRESGEPKALREYSDDQKVGIFLANLYVKMSSNFIRALRASKNVLANAQRWLDTADGIVMPLLLESGPDGPDIDMVNRLTKFALENCANNYAQFISRLKWTKKTIRKSLALGEPIPFIRDMHTYVAAFKLGLSPSLSHHDEAVHIQLWCQTRAVGLADTTMAENSLRKFSTTVAQEDDVPLKVLDKYSQAIRDATLCMRSAHGKHGHLSAGPKACLEFTQQQGGHTGRLIETVRTKRVIHRYDLRDLSRVSDPRRIKTSNDLLDFCVDWVLTNPSLSKVVKTHVVLEPSKARVITLSPWAVSRIMGVAAHILSPPLRHRFQTKSGMTKDRHLWNFMRSLHPQDAVWAQAQGKPVLSTDWAEATDGASRKFAKRIWEAILRHVSKIPDAPLAFLRLAMTLHTNERYILQPLGLGIDSRRVLRTRRGIFMGDYLTKIILTLAQDACARQACLSVYSIVGDDFIAFGEEDQLHTYLGCVNETGGRLSVEDTYISKKYMFYCEEMSLVPKDTTDLPIVAIKRSKSKICYIDAPRIRLLLPTSVETLGFSTTQAGRFSLLGKETRWAVATHSAMVPVFEIAQLLQHLNLPQEKDTLSAFIPVEIGGDGAYYTSAAFVKKVIDRSRHPKEVLFRIGELMYQRDGIRLVRSETLNQVVTKHRMWVPTYEKMRQLLPEEVIVEVSDLNSSLRAVTVKGFLESPSTTFFRMVKAAYYRSCLKGTKLEDLPKLSLVPVDRAFAGGAGNTKYFRMEAFLKRWVNPGFTYRDKAPYLVRADLTPLCDHLHLGLAFGKTRKTGLHELMGDWLSLHPSVLDREAEDFFSTLMASADLPAKLRDRLNLFVESDVIIKEEFLRNLPQEDTIILVSRDQRLASELVRLGEARRRKLKVYCFRPCFYLVGRLYDDDVMSMLGMDYHVIEDPGAMMFEDMTLFSEGSGPEWIFDPIEARPVGRFEDVWVVDRQRPNRR